MSSAKQSAMPKPPDRRTVAYPRAHQPAMIPAPFPPAIQCVVRRCRSQLRLQLIEKGVKFPKTREIRELLLTHEVKMELSKRSR